MKTKIELSMTPLLLPLIWATTAFLPLKALAQKKADDLVPIEAITAVESINSNGLWVIYAKAQLKNPCIDIMETSVVQWQDQEFLFMLKQLASFSAEPCIQKIEEKQVHFVVKSVAPLESLVFIDAFTGQPIPINTDFKEGENVYKE